MSMAYSIITPSSLSRSIHNCMHPISYVILLLIVRIGLFDNEDRKCVATATLPIIRILHADTRQVYAEMMGRIDDD